MVKKDEWQVLSNVMFGRTVGSVCSVGSVPDLQARCHGLECYTG